MSTPSAPTRLLNQGDFFVCLACPAPPPTPPAAQAAAEDCPDYQLELIATDCTRWFYMQAPVSAVLGPEPAARRRMLSFLRSNSAQRPDSLNISFAENGIAEIYVTYGKGKCPDIAGFHVSEACPSIVPKIVFVMLNRCALALSRKPNSHDPAINVESTPLAAPIAPLIPSNATPVADIATAAPHTEESPSKCDSDREKSKAARNLKSAKPPERKQTQGLLASFFKPSVRNVVETTNDSAFDARFRNFSLRKNAFMAPQPIERFPVTAKLDLQILNGDGSGAPRPVDFAPLRDCERQSVPEALQSRGIMKFIHFSQDVRPPYWGTFRRRSKYISGRTPFRRDETLFDYDYDSEAEWEEEECEGEDIGSDEEEEDEDADDNDDDDWIVEEDCNEDNPAFADVDAVSDAPKASSFPSGAQVRKIRSLTQTIIGPFFGMRNNECPHHDFAKLQAKVFLAVSVLESGTSVIGDELPATSASVTDATLGLDRKGIPCEMKIVVKEPKRPAQSGALRGAARGPKESRKRVSGIEDHGESNSKKSKIETTPVAAQPPSNVIPPTAQPAAPLRIVSKLARNEKDFEGRSVSSIMSLDESVSKLPESDSK